MKWSLKNKMFMRFILTLFVTQMITIVAATFLIDDFFIYRDMARFTELVEDLRESDLMSNGEDLRKAVQDRLGGITLIVGMDRMDHNVDVMNLDEIIKSVELQEDLIIKKITENEMILLGKLDDELTLVNVTRFEILDDIKEVLNIYLGISTVIIFIVLFTGTYYYINYFEKRMTFEAQKEIFFSLGQTADVHFAENGDHIERVSNMMYRFSRVMDYSKKDSEMMKLASTMHDIGKIAIPDAILKKPGKFTAEEFELMKRHTTEGKRILGNSNLPILQLASKIALYHHERVDGKGYPSNLIGEEIPISARMMSIIDVYDALTNDRCYKKAMRRELALNIIYSGRGTQFDSDLLDLFFEKRDYIIDGS